MPTKCALWHLREDSTAQQGHEKFSFFLFSRLETCIQTDFSSSPCLVLNSEGNELFRSPEWSHVKEHPIRLTIQITTLQCTVYFFLIQIQLRYSTLRELKFHFPFATSHFFLQIMCKMGWIAVTDFAKWKLLSPACPVMTPWETLRKMPKFLTLFLPSKKWAV